ncbi:MAG: hypothetical protein H7A45_07405 [Verrucomicrobiales bacterium]|nr:hypothetical protein [Verrucomicrobiales bacterium]MCP5528284.1 hypothetical protein [Verrucomicrobiales bacterium]
MTALPQPSSPDGTRRGLRVLALVLLAVLPGAGWFLASVAQTPSGQVRGDYRVPFFDPKRPDRQILQMSGQGARIQAGQVTLPTVRLDSFDREGRTNLHVFGTNCVYDMGAGMARSSDGLRVISADGRLALRGTGFQWWHTNNSLAISNGVVATVQRNAESTNPPVEIRGDTFRSRLDEEQAEFLGRVTVRDPEFDVDCDRLALRRGGAGDLEEIVAEGHVVVVNHQDGSRIRGERAVYRSTDEREQIELTGEPRWEDGLRSARAEVFLLDRRQNAFQARGHAVIVLPRNARGLTLGAGTAPAPGLPVSTNEFIELAAGLVTLQLPPTNGPVRSVTARSNVVIRLPAEDAEARAGFAEYTPEGLVRLREDPEWRWRDRFGAGELIEFHATNETFHIAGNARLRFPLLSFRSVIDAGQTNRDAQLPVALTNAVVEVRSDTVDYRDDRIRFGESVAARCVDGDTLLGTLVSRELVIGYRDRVESLAAQGDVHVEQAALRNRAGGSIARELSAARLTAKLGPGGRLRELEADGDVVGIQREWPPEAKVARVTRLGCATIAAWLAPDTNRVDRLVAEGEVQVTQGARMAWSERAEYTGADEVLALSGNPIVLVPEGRVLGADTLVWDGRAGAVRGRGRFITRWRIDAFSTNDLVFRPTVGGTAE